MESEKIIKGRRFRIINNQNFKNWGTFSGWQITSEPFKKGIPINEENNNEKTTYNYKEVSRNGF